MVHFQIGKELISGHGRFAALIINEIVKTQRLAKSLPFLQTDFDDLSPAGQIANTIYQIETLGKDGGSTVVLTGTATGVPFPI